MAGEVLSRLSNYKDARNHFKDALVIYENLKNPIGENHAHGSLANLYQLEGKWDKARKLYKKILAYYESTKMKHNIAATNFNLGRTEKGAGNIDEARAYYQRSYDLYTQIESSTAESVQNDLDRL